VIEFQPAERDSGALGPSLPQALKRRDLILGAGVLGAGSMLPLSVLARATGGAASLTRAGPITSTPCQLTSNQLFQLFKQYEGVLPLPVPYATIDVGSFNAATGAWTGMTTKVITITNPGEDRGPPPPRESGPPRNTGGTTTTTIIPSQQVPIAPVLLQFAVTNASGAWSATVNGFTQNAAAGQTTMSFNVWDQTSVVWTINAGGHTHADTLHIVRQVGIPAFGAFTIPVIPVAIIYAPPADSQKKSTASYGTNNTVGTTISWDLNTQTSSTTEAVFADGAAFKAGLSVVATALAVAGGVNTADTPGGASLSNATASKDLTSLASLFPSATDTEQTGEVQDNGGSMTVTYSSTTTLGTTAIAGGPGVGDNIVYYKDVQVAWSYNDGQWMLCPIGLTFVTTTPAQIQNQAAQLGLAAADQQTLLSLDPFVAGGPSATPPAGRFTVPPDVPASIQYGGGISYVHQFSVTRDTKGTTTTKTFTTDTSTWQPGAILEMFGVSPTKTETTTTLTNALGTDVSTTTTLNVNLIPGPTDLFSIAIWYDNLFGTWAFQQLALTDQPAVSGQGAPPGEVLTLEIGGQTHVTVADAKGNYTFRSSNIPSGSGQLLIPGKPATTVQVGLHVNKIGVTKIGVTRAP
jgi:hypothetical protein